MHEQATVGTDAKALTSPLVAVIVLNWNGEALTVRALESLNCQRYPRLLPVIVDNGSTGQREILARIAARFPDAHLIANPHNLGFAGGCNVGIRAALDLDVAYVLLLNNDATLDPGAVSTLVEAMESDRSLGAASPVISYADEPDRAWFVGGTLRMGRRVAAIHDHLGERIPFSNRDEPVLCDWLPGTAMLLRRQALKRAGLLDEDYFLYWEDVDLCQRLRRSGYRLALAPGARALHAVNASTSRLPRATVYYWERNRLRFIEHWGSLPTRLVAWSKILWRLGAWRVASPAGDPNADVKLAAYRDYLRRRFGEWKARQ